MTRTSSSSARARPGPPPRSTVRLRGPGRAAPGEVGVPPGQGLRRRPDAARGRRAGAHGRCRIREQDGWIRNEGLRVDRRRAPPRAGVARAVQLPVVRAGQVADVAGPHARRPRAGRRRQAAGAHHRHGPGARRAHGPRGGRAPPRSTPRRARRSRTARPVVIAADGVSARLAHGDGAGEARWTAPWASRSAPTSAPRGTTTRGWRATSSSGTASRQVDLLPGYGWIFSLGDGTANVGPRVGGLDGRGRRRSTTGRCSPRGWPTRPPSGSSRRTTRSDPSSGAALPMGFNRGPLYGNGLMLAGDSAGMISPFNGEGIAYGLQAGRVAADAIAPGARARHRGRARARVRHLRSAG